MVENFQILNDWEKQIVCSLSTLPIQFFSIPELSSLFQIDEIDHPHFFDTIHDLSLKGFLNREKAAYAIKPDVAEHILLEINPGIEEVPRIIKSFSDKLERTKFESEKTFLPIYGQLKVLMERIRKTSLHLAQLCYMLSSNLIKYGKYEDALIYNQMAVDISEKIDKQHPLVALLYRDKAYIHNKLGDAKKAIYFNLKDIEILEQHEGKYDDLLPDSYYALSKTYEGMHNYEKAVEYNLKAINCEKKKSKNNSLNLSSLYQNLAYYFAKLNNLQNASIFINKAVEIFPQGKENNKNQYLQLIKDQKRFNSLYEIELNIRKLKLPILVALGIVLDLLLWLLYKMIF